MKLKADRHNNLLNNSTPFLFIIPLFLSAFTHLWNPIGFPDLFIDEGTYMRRALQVLEGLGSQEGTYYDHPYFGQLFLAGVFWIIGYPDSLHPSFTQSSIESLYLVPRVLMGLLAVLDTFLIYKISEKRYDRRVALIASILFAVMPLTWLLRKIFLDNIMLPFLLSSILFTMYTKESNNAYKNMSLVLLSGIFLGVSIFTKISAFTMIPIVAYLLFSKNYNRKLKIILSWLVPLVAIPLVWPAQALFTDNIDNWYRGVFNQVTRDDSTPIKNVILDLLAIDPVLIILTIISILYLSVIKRDYLILLWIIPYLVLSAVVGRMAYTYWIMLIPAFCIVIANFIINLSDRISQNKIALRRIIPLSLILGIGTFGLLITLVLITSNVTVNQIQATAFVANKIFGKNPETMIENQNVTIISSASYSWIFQQVFHLDNTFDNFRDSQPVKYEKIILMKDKFYDRIVMQSEVPKKIKERLNSIYNNTLISIMFNDDRSNADKFDKENYPYTNMRYNRAGVYIDVRSNY